MSFISRWIVFCILDLKHVYKVETEAPLSMK